MMQQSKVIPLAIMLLLQMVIISCSKDIEDRNPSLLLYSNSKNVHYAVFESIEQLSYTVEAQYPAEKIIEWIKNELKSKGWKPLEESFLNPGLPNSIIKGWESFIDGTTNPNQKVHQWLSDWSNDSGDILTYGLRYSYPEKGKKDMNTLFVFGNFAPKELALKMLEAGAKQKDL